MHQQLQRTHGTGKLICCRRRRHVAKVQRESENVEISRFVGSATFSDRIAARTRTTLPPNFHARHDILIPHSIALCSAYTQKQFANLGTELLHMTTSKMRTTNSLVGKKFMPQNNFSVDSPAASKTRLRFLQSRITSSRIRHFFRVELVLFSRRDTTNFRTKVCRHMHF